MNNLGWLGTFWQDLRYGVRMLAKNPGFTVVAVLTLALGIGATTAVFSIFDTIFLRPLPFPEPNRLVDIYERRLDKPGPEWVSTPTFQDWKKQSHSFEMLAQSIGPAGITMRQSDQAGRIVSGRYVSEDYFHLLGAKPCQGRLFLPEDFKPGQNAIGVLSFDAWQRFFGSSPAIIGNAILVDGRLGHIVGVMCPGSGEISEEGIHLWMSIDRVDKREQRQSTLIVGRLKPGVNFQEAQAELDIIEARLALQYPDEQKGYGARVEPLRSFLYGNRWELFLSFLGAGLLLLLIACTNVANLLLARAVTRDKEMAVRASLGAGRWRLVRQLLAESLLLSGLGAGFGLLLAFAAVRLTVHFAPVYSLPRHNEIAVDARALPFLLLTTGLTVLLFGLLPALGATRPDLNRSLKEGGPQPGDHCRVRSIQGVLVIVQIAFSAVLLMGAGLMIHNVWRILHESVGFNTEHLTQMYIQFPRAAYTEHPRQAGTLTRLNPKTAMVIDATRERLKALPGVAAVSVGGSGVLWPCAKLPIGREGPPRRDDDEGACYEPVGAGYFRTLEIPLFRGRVFNDGDSRSSPHVAVISQSVARRYFQGQNPIGGMINIGHWESDDFDRRQVVGVVGDVRWSMYAQLRSGVYYPYSQLAHAFPEQEVDDHLHAVFLVRSASDSSNLTRSMERAVAEVAKDVVILTTWTAENTRWRQTRDTRFYTFLLALFAGTAVVLASVGVFGVTSYAVTQRTHELGIRMALGANPRDILWLILSRGARMVTAGLVIGLGVAAGLIHFVGSPLGWSRSLAEVKPMDPTAALGVAVLLAVTAMLACYVPARRATKVDPLLALRYE
jgi:putative ABC transport system permease protein